MQRIEGTNSGCLGILVLDLHTSKPPLHQAMLFIYHAHDIGRGINEITTSIKKEGGDLLAYTYSIQYSLYVPDFNDSL